MSIFVTVGVAVSETMICRFVMLLAPGALWLITISMLTATSAAAAAAVPAGWRLTGSGHRYAADVVPGPHGRVGRLRAMSGSSPAQDAHLTQTLDAAPWRGKVVDVSTALLLDGQADAGLIVTVKRPEPNATGSRDRSPINPPRGVWTVVQKRTYVEPDAVSIEVSATLDGVGTLLVQPARVLTVALPTKAPSPEVVLYLEKALAFMKATHMRRQEIDWPLLETRTRTLAAGAENPRDVYWVIQSAVGALGDRHSQFYPAKSSRSPPPVATAMDGDQLRKALPFGRIVNGRYGLIALPELDTSGPGGFELGRLYMETARRLLKTQDAQPLCGWIIDLRENKGGNMWPMLNGVAPLLGAPPFGAFIANDGTKQRWVLGSVGVEPEGVSAKEAPSSEPFTLKHAKLPLAVLTSNHTKSSGEAVTIAFSGRENSRRFGEPTAGLTSGNRSLDLPDGALLAIASTWEQDRNGREFKDRIQPDELALPDQTLVLATRWLGSRCGDGSLHPRGRSTNWGGTPAKNRSGHSSPAR